MTVMMGRKEILYLHKNVPFDSINVGLGISDIDSRQCNSS